MFVVVGGIPWVNWVAGTVIVMVQCLELFHPIQSLVSVLVEVLGYNMPNLIWATMYMGNVGVHVCLFGYTGFTLLLVTFSFVHCVLYAFQCCSAYFCSAW